MPENMDRNPSRWTLQCSWPKAASVVRSPTTYYNCGMSTLQKNLLVGDELITSHWHELAGGVLQGHPLSWEQGLSILRSPDDSILDLLAAAYRIRRKWWGNQVRLNYLINAKSGACAEDCGYCTQSRASKADIPRYGLLPPDEILSGAKAAFQRQAKTYCIVTSGRGPSSRVLDLVTELVPRIKREYDLEICVSSGLLALEQAQRLKACGVDRVNHNLNTSRRFYPEICTTHTFQDRLDTLWAVRKAGMEICSGGIVGMGEEDADVVDLALELGKLEVEALPVNFFTPVQGTPITATDPKKLSPRQCLKVLALFRLANPRADLRVAAGRELHLGWLQPLALFAANSMFVGDYLTTKGQPPNEDYRMIQDLGFEVVEEGPRT
jgi:biotin synthase